MHAGQTFLGCYLVNTPVDIPQGKKIWQTFPEINALTCLAELWEQKIERLSVRVTVKSITHLLLYWKSGLFFFFSSSLFNNYSCSSQKKDPGMNFLKKNIKLLKAIQRRKLLTVIQNCLLGFKIAYSDSKLLIQIQNCLFGFKTEDSFILVIKYIVYHIIFILITTTQCHPHHQPPQHNYCLYNYHSYHVTIILLIIIPFINKYIVSLTG